MPVYEFVCRNCQTHFDTLVASFKAADDVTCRACESDDVRRLVSTFAVSGFDDTMVATGSLAGDAGGGGCCGGSCGCGH
jgi:putative FmdB family regulatory protein